MKRFKNYLSYNWHLLLFIIAACSSSPKQMESRLNTEVSTQDAMPKIRPVVFQSVLFDVDADNGPDDLKVLLAGDSLWFEVDQKAIFISDRVELNIVRSITGEDDLVKLLDIDADGKFELVLSCMHPEYTDRCVLQIYKFKRNHFEKMKFYNAFNDYYDELIAKDCISLISKDNQIFYYASNGMDDNDDAIIYP